MILEEFVQVLGLEIEADDLVGFQNSVLATTLRLSTMVAVATTAAAAVTKVLSATGETTNAVRFAQANEISFRSLQRLTFAAKQYGIEGGALQGVLQSIGSASRGAFVGQNSGAAASFARLGINIQAANGQLKNSDTLLMEVSTALARLGNSPFARTIAESLGIGPEMNLFLRQGAGGINELADEGERLGAVLSDRAGQSAIRFTKSVDRLKLSLNTLISETGRPIVDWATQLSDSFQNFLKSGTGQDTVALVGSLFDAFTKLAKTPIDGLTLLGDFLDSLLGTDYGVVIGLIAAAIVGLGVALGPTAFLAIGLVAALQDIFAFARGVENTFSEKLLGGVQKVGETVGGPLSELFSPLLDLIPGTGAFVPAAPNAASGAQTNATINLETRIDINGAGDPEEVARQTYRELVDQQRLQAAFRAVLSGRRN